MENSKKITELVDKLLADYKQSATTCITEFPCDDEKKALSELNEEIEEYKNKLQELLK